MKIIFAIAFVNTAIGIAGADGVGSDAGREYPVHPGHTFMGRDIWSRVDWCESGFERAYLGFADAAEKSTFWPRPAFRLTSRK